MLSGLLLFETTHVTHVTLINLPIRHHHAWHQVWRHRQRGPGGGPTGGPTSPLLGRHLEGSPRRRRVVMQARADRRVSVVRRRREHVGPQGP